jgi:hypothetical protein
VSARDASDPAATIARSVQAVQERIAAAARAAARRPEEVRLIAVTKTHPASAVRAAYGLGLRDFGENYAQELAMKAEELADLGELRWHMIGHLQRNKARLVARWASVLHTLDSSRLATEMGKRAAEQPVAPQRRFEVNGASDERLAVLVEVNVGGEAQKNGCSPQELPALLEAVERQPALRLAGLMTVPPHADDPAGARAFFDRVVELREANGGSARLPELSMGMTHDLEQAVAAGATIVRVGTAIFGVRARGAGARAAGGGAGA